MAGMEEYLDRSERPKVEFEEQEYCLRGPEESDVDIRHIVANACTFIFSVAGSM